MNYALRAAAVCFVSFPDATKRNETKRNVRKGKERKRNVRPLLNRKKELVILGVCFFFRFCSSPTTISVTLLAGVEDTDSTVDTVGASKCSAVQVQSRSTRERERHTETDAIESYSNRVRPCRDE
jgi:hypothetical protein